MPITWEMMAYDVGSALLGAVVGAGVVVIAVLVILRLNR